MTDDRSLTATQADGDGPDGGAIAPAPTGRGACFGRFVVLGGLGAGGMGMVLAAYDPELDRRVALKLLHSHRAAAPRGRRRASGCSARPRRWRGSPTRTS